MKLKDYLLENDITAKDFALLLSVSPSKVSRWLNGKHDISLQDGYRILYFTNGYVTPIDMLGDVDIDEVYH